MRTSTIVETLNRCLPYIPKDGGQERDLREAIVKAIADAKDLEQAAEEIVVAAQAVQDHWGRNLTGPVNDLTACKESLEQALADISNTTTK